MGETTETQPKYKRIGGADYWPAAGDADVGTSLIGLLKGREEQTSKLNPDKPQTVLIIAKPDGDMKQVSVSAGLVRANEQMEVGKAYRITFVGRQKGKGPQPFKKFEVDLIEDYDPKAFEVPF